MQDTLDDVGDVQSFVQQGEDVTDQLTDLDTRITNQRASVARIRELYATATDVEAIVRIEGELTNRETALEQLLAMQASTQARVAMSTLTIDITETPAAAATTDDGDDDGTTIGDALGAGWSAFAGALFAIALVLTAAMPFLLLAAGVGLIVWLVLRRVRRERARRVTAPTPEAAEQRGRRRQPSGVSTQSATVPSGKANGARSPVWAKASGTATGPSASPQRCQRRAGTSASRNGPPASSISPWTTPSWT